jgi:hypothetical protein
VIHRVPNLTVMVLPFFQLLTICNVFSLYHKQAEHRKQWKINRTLTGLQCSVFWAGLHQFLATDIATCVHTAKVRDFLWSNEQSIAHWTHKTSLIRHRCRVCYKNFHLGSGSLSTSVCHIMCLLFMYIYPGCSLGRIAFHSFVTEE